MAEASGRWSVERTKEWYNARPWPCGCNYVPGNAVNTTELWQADGFSPEVIRRELTLAQATGLNSLRVFVQYLVWQADPTGLVERLAHFLELAAKHDMSVMYCLFDDCAFAGKQPYLGPQDAPAPGVHNSGWTPSPGHARVVDQDIWPSLRDYVQSVIGAFRQETRIVAWDLYNEPGNGGMGARSLPLVEASFVWARDARPTQPLTVGIWNGDEALNALALSQSDVVSFHQYGPLEALERQATALRREGRPLLCTEWMARTRGSLIGTHLPFFWRERIGCYSWGLVRGKTQTYLPWGSTPGAGEPALWFHDLFYPDGQPYDAQEIALLRRHAGRV